MSPTRTLSPRQSDLFEAVDAPQALAPPSPEAPPAESRAGEVLRQLYTLAEQGDLRRLDSALASFMTELEPDTPPTVLVATALLSHLEGQGHTCLPLSALCTAPEWLPALAPWWGGLPSSPARWLDDLRQSPLVALPGQSEALRPLVLNPDATQPLLYLQRHWAHEQTVAHQLRTRVSTPWPVDEAQSRRWLAALFGVPPGATAPEDAAVATDWQQVACALALRAGLTVITGGPGTGKTYTAARLLALLLATSPRPDELRIALAAPTGKAAARLRQSLENSLAELGQRLQCSGGGEPGAGLDLGLLAQRMGPARTLHSLLGARPDTRQLRFHARRPLDVDVLIVDEASMVHLEMMSALLQALPATARLVLLGDKDQLSSVEAGAVLGDVCRDAHLGRYSPGTAAFVQRVAGQGLPAAMQAQGSVSALAQQTVMLRVSRRFDGAIGQLALAVNAGDAAQATACLDRAGSGAVHRLRAGTAHGATAPLLEALASLACSGREGAPGGYGDYLQCMRQGLAKYRFRGEGPDERGEAPDHSAWVQSVLRAFDRFRLLCATHLGDWGTQGLNQRVQQALVQAGWLKVTGEWFAGRPVMVTRNDPALQVFNGDVGVVLPSPGGALRAYFLDGDGLRSVGVGRLAHVETAFAMTVHKSQGSEFTHTVLVLPAHGGELLTRELVYTGITRARACFTLVEAKEGQLPQALARTSTRHSGLGPLLHGPGVVPGVA